MTERPFDGGRRPGGDEGSAALEFITIGIILLIPLIYLVVALGQIQQQALGVEAAARHMARVIALTPDAGSAMTRSERILAGTAEEYGIDRGAMEVTMTCRPQSAPCPSAGAIVTITVTAQVPLPLFPPVLGLDEAASVGVEGSAVQKMSRLWGQQ